MHPHQPPPPGTPRPVRTIGVEASQDSKPDPVFTTNLARYTLLLAALFLGIGVVWTGVIVSEQSPRTEGSRDWPNTLGMVLRCEERASTLEDPEPKSRVTYRYDVDDRRYESQNHTLGPYQHFSCSEYPLGKGVRVYYAPWRPALSTLTPGAGREGLLGQLAGAVLCMLVGLVLGVSQVAILISPQWMRARREPGPQS